MNPDRSWLKKHIYSKPINHSEKPKYSHSEADVEHGHEPKFLKRATRWERRAGLILTGAEIDRWQITVEGVLLKCDGTGEEYVVSFGEWVELTQTLSRERRQ